MRLRNKILLVVFLGVLASWLFGCSDTPTYSSGQIVVDFHPETTTGDVDEPFLRQLYSSYNDLYFDNKLPKDTTVALSLGGNLMADTGCENDNGTECEIRVNPHFVVAGRTAENVMLHEMCHEKVWSRTLEANRSPMEDKWAYDHGKAWQSCMLSLDAMGAFRKINIDNYSGK